MSSIQSNAANVRQVLSSRSDVASPRRTPSPDQTLMYAWSIGTTRAAQEHQEHAREPEQREPEQPRHEECPPEVYIG